MLHPWQRIAGCVAAAVLALFLTGCEVHGTVDIRSGTQAEANLIFTKAEVDCLGLTSYAGLVIKGTPESDGDQTCRAQGTIDLEALKDFGIQLRQAGEYVLVDLALPQQFGYMPTKVDITFPGKVVDGGGAAVSGNSVRLDQGTGITDVSPVRLVALSHPGPEWWVLGLLAGFSGGIVLTVAVLLLLRRARHLRVTLHTDAEELPDPDAASPTKEAQQPIPAAATGSGASGANQDADYGALFAPPPRGTVAPEVPTPAPPPAAPVASPPADHRIWAPPEEQGRPVD